MQRSEFDFDVIGGPPPAPPKPPAPPPVPLPAPPRRR
jgi:hypothetical protein